MGKFLFWFVVILGLMVGARLLARHQARQKQPRRRAAHTRPAASPEAMVRCHHCGIHLPRSEAIQRQGQVWCSEEHARLGGGS